MAAPRMNALVLGLLCLGLGACTERGSVANSDGKSASRPGAAAVGTTQHLLGGPSAPAGAGTTENTSGFYSLRGIYFNSRQFSSAADCLTAASAQALPLDVCR